MTEKIFKNNTNNLVVKIKISPNSSKNTIFFDGEILKLKITAPPIDNKANKAVIQFLSKKLRCAKSKVSILKGELSKEKTISIEGVTQSDFEKIID